MSANETPAGEPIDLADVIADLRDRIAQLEMRRDELNADVDAANAKLEKAESKRGKVRPEVFEKVVAEYAHAKSESEAARAKIDREAVSLRVDLDLAETTLREREEAARLAEEAARRAEEEARRRAESATLPPAERQEIERRIEEYRAESGRIESELEEPDKALEELEFRRDMDEFATDDEYEKAVGPVRETIERLRGRLAQIEGESAELRKTLEEDAAKAQAAARPVEAAPAIADSADDQAGWSWADSGGAARAEGEVADAAAEPESPAEPARVESLLVEEPTPASENVVREAVPVAREVVLHEEVVEDWSDLERDFFSGEGGDGRFFANPALILHDPGGHERVFELVHDNMVIGSAGLGDVDIFVGHKSVDKKHARIRMEHGRYVIKDLGSHGGTFINGKRVRKERLNHLDKLKVGDVFFQVRLM